MTTAAATTTWFEWDLLLFIVFVFSVCFSLLVPGFFHAGQCKCKKDNTTNIALL